MGSRLLRSTLLATGVGLAALAGCTADSSLLAEEAMQGGNARFHPETGELYRLYQYFPNEEVYRSVYHYTWYWQDDDGRWWRTDDLPTDRAVSKDFYELLELPSGKPYEFHAEVTEAHPSYEMLVAETARLNEIEGGFTIGQGEALANVDTAGGER